MNRNRKSSNALPLKARETLRQLARAAQSGLVTVQDAAKLFGYPQSIMATRLARLARQGWLTRARRGLYLVLPLESRPESPVAEDPWILARVVYDPCYIGGWTAAEHWGLTEQLFRSTFVVTAANIRRRSERILGAEFRLVRVAPARLRGTTLVWRGKERVAVSDRERTIADALADPSWVGGVRQLIDIFVAYGASRERDLPKLLARIEEVNRGAVFKRLGFLAERVWPEATEIREAALARRTTGVIKLDPAVKARGRLNKRWGLWVNVSVPDQAARQ